MPTSLSERFGRATNRLYPHVTRQAGDELAVAALTGSLDDLEGRRHCTVVSFRRTGEPIATPVWFGLADGRLYFRSLAGSQKLRRIARNPDVLVAPSTPRGRPTGAPFAGRARLLDDADEAAAAERHIQANYGPGRSAYEWAIRDAEARYVEVVPAAPGALS